MTYLCAECGGRDPENCHPGKSPVAWPQKRVYAAHYWLRDPHFSATKAGTSLYPGTTPETARIVLELLKHWKMYPPKPVELGKEPLYGR